MNKKRKLELEITAVELWWATFGKPGMSSAEDRTHMCQVLHKLTLKLNKI